MIQFVLGEAAGVVLRNVRHRIGRVFISANFMESISLVLFPLDSLFIDDVAQVLSVKVWRIARLEPPAAFIGYRTVPITLLIIIPVLGAELHLVVIRQRVSRRAWIRVHTQLVQRLLIANAETAVFRISPASTPVLYLHSQLARSAGRQAMDLVKSQPKLAGQLPRARFVLTPAQVEVLRAVLSSLEHRTKLFHE